MSYTQFRRFIADGNRALRFLRGEPDAQARVLEEWTADLRERGAKHGTVRGYWCAVVSLFDRFTTMHGVSNPLRRFRRRRASPAIPRALYKTDAERMLAHVKHARGNPLFVTRNLAIVAWMMLTDCDAETCCG